VTDRAEAQAEVDWRARAQAAEGRAAEAWSAYHLLAAERGNAEHYKYLLEDREHSMSWRITAPLRFGMLVLRWLVKKVKEELRGQ
jgi:hypothetical protein